MFGDFLNLIYPNLCLSCDNPLRKGEDIICIKCKLNLPITDYFKNSDNPISSKFYGKVKLEYAFSFLHFIKKGSVQKLLHQLKYNNKPEIGLLLGKWFGNELTKIKGLNFDYVIPVPMHRTKLKKRGYNQADPIAEGISSTLNSEWKHDVLLKVDNTESQTKKGRFDRFKNTEYVFKFNEDYSIKNKHVLIVDDVITTGSTLEACAKILIENGASVSIATLAHAK